MTTEQKSQIDQYRQSGMRYSEIARRMGLLETTVRSYCYRKPAPSVVDAPATSVCPQCGKALPASKFRPRRFCSDRCRNKYWLTHMDNSSNSSAEKLTRQYCGKPFVDYERHHRKYCSHPCFIAARYGVSGMDDRQFDRELKYQVSMSIARQMLETAVIDADAFARWQEKLITRYDSPIGWIVSNREG